jgi:hypothetical protein
MPIFHLPIPLLSSNVHTTIKIVSFPTVFLIHCTTTAIIYTSHLLPLPDVQYLHTFCRLLSMHYYYSPLPFSTYLPYLVCLVPVLLPSNRFILSLCFTV